MRKGFTLIELMVSIVILTIMMLFLYKSYAGLNLSNKVFEKELEKISKAQRIKKVIYLDFRVAISNETNSSAIQIINQDTNKDVVFMQTKNSLHRRINPYVAYIFKEKNLYRLESLKKFTQYPLDVQSEFVVDKLASVQSFRVYPSKISKEISLVHIIFEDKEELLLKIKSLNTI